ncbi:MAG: FHA domain-containing protein [Elainellaceae cyanobacterium]
MSGDFVQLRWEDPDTGELHDPLLKTPIAIGRETPQMPEQLGALPVSQLEMPHKQVSRYHALITVVNQQICITDKSVNGTFLNGRSVERENQPFTSKDTLRIGPYKITAAIARDGATNATELNFDHSHLSKQAAGPSSNALFIWIGGLVVLALMGLVTWGVFGLLLERSRPQIDTESSLPAPVPVSQLLS